MIAGIYGRFGTVMGVAGRAVHTMLKDGPRVFIKKTYRYIRQKQQYSLWIQQNEKDLRITQNLSYCPLLSVVVPVYNVSSKMLTECIESVLKQTYDNWQLVLVDDCSSMESVRDTLKKYEHLEKVRVIYRTTNGHISRSTNTGIEAAEGEFVGLMDCDDTLAVNALFEVAKKLNENPHLDYIYSDEDKLTENGKRRMDPFFKPDWSPDTFMSLMYTGHFSVFRKSLLDELDGLRIGYEGSQDYDLVLRLMEKTDRIGHIPMILYHWRMRKESTANSMSAKPYTKDSTARAKEDALERRGLTGSLEWDTTTLQYHVVYQPQGTTKVSIIIPSKDNAAILKQCLSSIWKHTAYPHYEIIIVDNGSHEETKKELEQLAAAHGMTYLYAPMEFNFSCMCNMGAEKAAGEYLLFLNDDIEVRGEEWLSRLLGHCQLAHVGAVGCKLYYPDEKTIQHDGVLNLPIGPSHAFYRCQDNDEILYYGRNLLEYNFSIVTGACLMVAKEKFNAIGGFEESLPVAYNDVELCFKLLDKGYFNVLRNDVVLIHHESISRGYEDESEQKLLRQKHEMAHLYELHPDRKGRDDFYNRNLAGDRGDFALHIE